MAGIKLLRDIECLLLFQALSYCFLFLDVLLVIICVGTAFVSYCLFNTIISSLVLSYIRKSYMPAADTPLSPGFFSNDISCFLTFTLRLQLIQLF